MFLKFPLFLGFVKFTISCYFYVQLNKAGQQLKILPHKVINDAAEEIELCSSVECKGIIGNDSRHYVLDLLRTFPPDVNFLKCMLQKYKYFKRVFNSGKIISLM